jgi:hypothetical protein
MQPQAHPHPANAQRSRRTLSPRSINLTATWRPVPRSSASTTKPKVPELRSLTCRGGWVGGWVGVEGCGYGWVRGVGARREVERRRRQRGGGTAAPPPATTIARAFSRTGPAPQQHEPSRTSRAPRAGPRSAAARPTSRRSGAEAHRRGSAGRRATDRIERSWAVSARPDRGLERVSVEGVLASFGAWSPPPRSEEGACARRWRRHEVRWRRCGELDERRVCQGLPGSDWFWR